MKKSKIYIYLQNLKNFRYKKIYILFVVSLLILLLMNLFIIGTYRTPEFSGRLFLPFFLLPVMDFCFFILLVSFYKTIIIVDNSRAYEAAKNERAKALLQNQTLASALQSQINPHFLYNTLDSIRGKALDDGSRETADMIAILSSFFRYTIGSRNPIVSIEQELINTDNYIKILQYRFSNRFTIEKDIQDISDNIMQYSIPKLILQPLIENAISHGLSDTQSGGVIRISLYTTQSRIIISVIDNGKGIDDAALKKLNHSLTYNWQALPEQTGYTSGIALSNVNTRIKLMYGALYGLVIYSTVHSGTEVQITLPNKEYSHEKGSFTS